jgi:hypothetical protein
MFYNIGPWSLFLSVIYDIVIANIRPWQAFTAF